MSAVAPSAKWEEMPSRVVVMTERILEMFAHHGCKGTFFFLGWVAERHPRLVQQVAAAGHEIACHSFWHRAVFRLSPTEFRDDSRRAKEVIEQAAGVAVIGYRAPSFSMTPGTEWASEILAELGFKYDSSVNPIRHDFYNNSDAPRTPYRIAGGKLVQLPIATIRRLGTNFPCGGGAYLRFFPVQYFNAAFRALNRDGEAAVVYFHPWELDVDQPRLQARLKSRVRQYTGLSNTRPRLESLLRSFKFAPIVSVFPQLNSSEREGTH